MDIHCAFLSTWVVLKFKKNTKLGGERRWSLLPILLLGKIHIKRVLE